MPPLQLDPTAAFLNIPYDKQFEKLYLAYIAGITSFGLVPKATLEIPGGVRRLDRISELIQTCKYSFHDLSRVQVDRSKPRTPRFNMPFELGLTIGLAKSKLGKDQIWFVFEALNHRIQKSLSDLNGTDIYVHHGTVKGIFRELGNALVRSVGRPTVSEMTKVYNRLRKALPEIMKRRGATSGFQASVFHDLVFLAASLRKAVLKP